MARPHFVAVGILPGPNPGLCDTDSDTNNVGRAFSRGSPAFLVDPRRRHLLAAEQLLNGGDVHSGIKKKRCPRAPQRVRRVDALSRLRRGVFRGLISVPNRISYRS